MKTTSKFLFCCLNSKKTKHLEYILLVVNCFCFLFYILFFSTVAWNYIPLLYRLLYSLNLFFLLTSITINIYFIHIRKKRLINSRMNDIAFSLTILIIIICFIAIIISCTSSYKIFFSQVQTLNDKIILYKSKSEKAITIISKILTDIIWFFILFLWSADFVRIKIRIEDSFDNYVKRKSFQYNKESQENLAKNINSNKIFTNRKKQSNSIKSVNQELIKDSNNLNISNISSSNDSYNSNSLNDSFQKPVNMIMVGTDEKGYPIYAKQSSLEKSSKSNDSDSYSSVENKFDETNYIKFNDIPLNININNNNLEKKHILEKENDEGEPKIVNKINEKENENENENENNFNIKDNFIPLQSVENDKESENKNIELEEPKTNIIE